MSAVHGASAETQQRLRAVLAVVTLLLAALVVIKAAGPVIAEAQSPSTATVAGLGTQTRGGGPGARPPDCGCRITAPADAPPRNGSHARLSAARSRLPPLARPCCRDAFGRS